MVANQVGLFSGRFLGRPECFVNFRRRILLHSRQDMRIQVQCNPDLGMPKPLAGNLGMHAALQHMRCVGVTQIVEANTG